MFYGFVSGMKGYIIKNKCKKIQILKNKNLIGIDWPNPEGDVRIKLLGVTVFLLQFITEFSPKIQVFGDKFTVFKKVILATT